VGGVPPTVGTPVTATEPGPGKRVVCTTCDSPSVTIAAATAAYVAATFTPIYSHVAATAGADEAVTAVAPISKARVDSTALTVAAAIAVTVATAATAEVAVAVVFTVPAAVPAAVAITPLPA
jgi:hypothetical protein